MAKLTIKCKETDKFYSYDAKHDVKYYEKYIDYFSWIPFFSYEQSVYRLFRYINFIDHTNLVSANVFNPNNLRRKRPICYSKFWFADHTTAYKRKGYNFPEILLTEPYSIHHEIEDIRHTLIKAKFQYKIIEPGPKSLWHQDKKSWFSKKNEDKFDCSNSWAIFIWDSDFYEPDSNFFRYDNAQKVHKRVVVHEK